jgi:nicotinamide mononucleotide transporter
LAVGLSVKHLIEPMEKTLPESILLSFAAHPLTEKGALLCLVLYVFLAAKGNIWCWLCGFISAFLYTFVFIYLKIDSQVLLNTLYMLIAVCGWIVWLAPIRKDQKSHFVYWPVMLHVKLTTGFVLFAIFIRYFLATWFTTDYPMLESFLVFLSIQASLMTAYRVIEGWLYWIVIDVLSLFIFWNNQGSITNWFFMSSALLAIYGFSNWRRLRQNDITLSQSAAEKPVSNF